MHGKLVLSPEYFNEAISDLVVQTFSFLNQINRLLFCGTHGVVAMQSSRTAPIFSFTICTLKHFMAISYCCSQVLVLTKEGLHSACVHS